MLLSPSVKRPASTIAFLALPSRICEFAETVASRLPDSARNTAVCAAIAEALGNAIIHGALRISSRLRDEGSVCDYLDAILEAEARYGTSREVQVTIREAANQLGISITDDGPGFSWRVPLKPGCQGIGLKIMRAACVTLQWNEPGNEVTLWIDA